MINRRELIKALIEEYGFDYEPELDCVDEVIEKIHKSHSIKISIDMSTAIFLYNCAQVDKHIGY
jgi:hypothetical protein